MKIAQIITKISNRMSRVTLSRQPGKFDNDVMAIVQSTSAASCVCLCKLCVARELLTDRFGCIERSADVRSSFLSCVENSFLWLKRICSHPLPSPHFLSDLHEESHGILSNTMFDPRNAAVFTISNSSAQTDPFWWRGGSPIWITAERQNRRASTCFWPGSQGRRAELEAEPTSRSLLV